MTEGIIQKVFSKASEKGLTVIEIEQELIAEIEKEISYMQSGINNSLIEDSKVHQNHIDLFKVALIGNGEKKE